MFCENCGMKLENGARICPGCGRNIGMQPVNPMPARRIIFTPEEQKVLKSGCNVVSYTYLGYAIFCSLCALMFLIFSIVCISDAYYYGPSNTIFSVAAFLDFAGVLIAFFIKFAEYRKYAKCVDGDTNVIISKFRGYNIAGGIVLSILFFWPAIVPVILTSTKINDPIKKNDRRVILSILSDLGFGSVRTAKGENL